MIHSLRGRLFVGLTLMIVATGGSAGYLTFRWAFDEAIEMQDSLLSQIGAVALNATFRNDMPLRGVDADAQVLIEELGNVAPRTRDDSLLWSFPDGLHDTNRGGQPWRVLLQTRSDGSRFAVGQPTSIPEYEEFKEMVIAKTRRLKKQFNCEELIFTVEVEGNAAHVDCQVKPMSDFLKTPPKFRLF